MHKTSTKIRFILSLLTLLTLPILTACNSESNHNEFLIKLGNGHDYGTEKDSDLLFNDGVRPLPKEISVNSDKVVLGKRLFHDPRLSKDNSISCASCHILNEGGDDNSQFSIGISNKIGEINSPTVLNSTFNFSQFWNGRSFDLSDQVNGPLHSPIEMASDWEQVIDKISKDKDYIETFQQVYNTGINKENISDSIAEFERSLITESPFDRYLRGDLTAISQHAQDGFHLFKKHGCISCHHGINIGGSMFQKFGALVSYYSDKNYNQTDKGRENITDNIIDRHVFKVPSLRNVALTAPYFHNGSVKSLEKAIEMMGHLQLGRQLPNQDINKIKLFLETLTGDNLASL